NQNEAVSVACEKLHRFKISQIPVVNDAGEFVGAIDDSVLFQKLLKDQAVRDRKVSEVMLPSFPIVKCEDSIDLIAKKINRENSAVLLMDRGGNWHIITRYDVIDALS